jgi:hypothetical protein
MVDSVKMLTTDEAARDVPAFFSSHPITQAVKVLEQILERQRVNVALRQRESEALSQSMLT